MSISVISFINNIKLAVAGAPVSVPAKTYAWTARLAGTVNFHVNLETAATTSDPLLLGVESVFIAVGANQTISLIGDTPGYITVSEVRSAGF
jgi:hypothetical protein